MELASASAAEPNSLQPSVPDREAVRDMRSFAPACDGGLPSSLTTVARTTSSPRASRLASSSSTLDRGTLGTGWRAREDRADDRVRVGDLIVGRCVTGGEPKTAERLLE